MSVIIVVVCIVVISLILFTLINRQVETKNDKAVKQVQNKQYNDNNLLNLTDFFIGRIPIDKYQSSNLCNNKVLYPINGLDVDYGNKMPKDCPCYQGITPP